MVQAKITDEQLRQSLQEGLNRKQIAAKYNVTPYTVSSRIRKMQATEEAERRLREHPPENIQRMDTVIRLTDRTWFRVMEINEEKAVLQNTLIGEFPAKTKTVTVSREKLNLLFEKKDYPPVKCYIDPTLKKKQEGKKYAGKKM